MVPAVEPHFSKFSDLAARVSNDAIINFWPFLLLHLILLSPRVSLWRAVPVGRCSGIIAVDPVTWCEIVSGGLDSAVLRPKTIFNSQTLIEVGGNSENGGSARLYVLLSDPWPLPIVMCSVPFKL